MTTKLFSLLILVTVNLCFSQCPGGGYTYTSQAALDDGWGPNSLCTAALETSISISGDDITNLDVLSNLTAIHELNIANVPNLIDISGIDNLVTCTNLTLQIPPIMIGITDVMPSLQAVVGSISLWVDSPTFVGFNALTQLGGGSIFTNSTVINAFNNLTSVGQVDSNSGLQVFGYQATSAVILQELQYVDGILTLNNFPVLPVLSSLNNVGGLRINSCSSQNLINLPNLYVCRYNLELTDNFFLTDISALNNILSLNGAGLVIRNNDLLSDLNGITQLTTFNSLEITDNAQLAVCNYPFICSFISNPDSAALIFNNAEGCNSPEEVLQQCNLKNLDFEMTKVGIYPIPTTSLLTLQTVEQIEAVKIFDIAGRSTNISDFSNNRVDVSKLSDGVYFIEIRTEYSSTVRKFIKN